LDRRIPYALPFARELAMTIGPFDPDAEFLVDGVPEEAE